MKAVIVERGLS